MNLVDREIDKLPRKNLACDDVEIAFYIGVIKFIFLLHSFTAVTLTVLGLCSLSTPST